MTPQTRRKVGAHPFSGRTQPGRAESFSDAVIAALLGIANVIAWSAVLWMVAP